MLAHSTDAPKLTASNQKEAASVTLQKALQAQHSVLCTHMPMAALFWCRQDSSPAVQQPQNFIEAQESPVLAAAKRKARGSPDARHAIHAAHGGPVGVIGACLWPEYALILVALIGRHGQQLALRVIDATAQSLTRTLKYPFTKNARSRECTYGAMANPA